MDKLNEFICSIVSQHNDLIDDASLDNELKMDILGDIITDSETIIKLCNEQIENLIN